MSLMYSAICIVYIVLMLFHLARCSRFLCRLGCLSQLSRALARLAQRLRGWSKNENRDEMQLLVNRQVMELRSALMARLTHIGLGPACGMALLVVFAWARGTHIWQPVGHILVLALLICLMSVSSVFPKPMLSGRMRHLSYAWFMMLGTAEVLTALPTPYTVNQANAWWLLARLPVSIVYGNVYGVAVCNGLGVLGMFALFPSIASSPIQGVETKQQVLYQEIVYSAFTIAISVAADGFLRASIRHMLEAKGLTLTNSAMSHLLDLVCDTVFELDADLRLSEPPPRLAALLHVEQAHVLEGKQFQHFIQSAEDRQKFESHLTSAQSGEQTMPQAFNLVLGDSMQQKLDVEVFSVAFLDVEGCACFLVGLKEASERPAPLGRMKKFKKPSEPKPNRPMNGPGTPPASILGHLDPAEADGLGSDAAGGLGFGVGGDGGDAGGGLGTGGSDAGQASSGSPAPRAPSARSSRSRSSGRLSNAPVYKGLMVTKELTIQQVASEALWRINVPVKATMCCSRHGLIHSLRQALDELQKRGCAAMSRRCKAQCRSCGVLEMDTPADGDGDDGPWECEMCGAFDLRPIRGVVSL